MLPTIRVDDEVFAELQREAQPFVDTPNTVLRRKFGLDKGTTKAKRRKHVSPGTILPHEEYFGPLLQALAERGGSAPAGEVIEAVGDALENKLTDVDRQPLDSGAIRWRNRVQWARHRLRDENLLHNDSPTGVWELTQAGFEAATKFWTEPSD